MPAENGIRAARERQRRRARRVEGLLDDDGRGYAVARDRAEAYGDRDGHAPDRPERALADAANG